MNTIKHLMTAVLVLASVPREKDASGRQSSDAPVSNTDVTSIGGGDETQRRTWPEGGTDVVELQVPYRASGTHTCYKSGTSFRPTCEVSGEGYANCDVAEAALKADDCCPRIEAGTHSFAFSMNHCTPE
jgi:hypothetical protein